MEIIYEVCMTESDLDLCYDLWLSAASEQGMGPPFKPLLYQRIALGRILLARADGVIVAFYSYDVREEDNTAITIFLVVHPDYRRLGIGTSLCDFAWVQYQQMGITRVEATALSKDTTLNAFHQSRGNTFVGPKEFGSNEYNVYMREFG